MVEHGPKPTPCRVCGSADVSLVMCGGCADAAGQLVPARPAASSVPPPDPRIGPCSFCSTASADLRALFLGPALYGEPVRLCDQCLDLCCDIVAERRAGESWLTPKKLGECPSCRQSRPVSSLESCCVTCFARARAPAEVRRNDLLVVEVPIPPLPRPEAGAEFACSFCHRPRSLVRGLISGPRVFVCELCITEFAVGLEPHYWWGWERPVEPSR
ncbi:MAG TPA: ClpX C4-type zinc finger protein [Polyangia bacterium]|jgi:hypothetical protein